MSAEQEETPSKGASGRPPLPHPLPLATRLSVFWTGAWTLAFVTLGAVLLLLYGPALAPGKIPLLLGLFAFATGLFAALHLAFRWDRLIWERLLEERRFSGRPKFRVDPWMLTFAFAIAVFGPVAFLHASFLPLEFRWVALAMTGFPLLALLVLPPRRGVRPGPIALFLLRGVALLLMAAFVVLVIHDTVWWWGRHDWLDFALRRVPLVPDSFFRPVLLLAGLLPVLFVTAVLLRFVEKGRSSEPADPETEREEDGEAPSEDWLQALFKAAKEWFPQTGEPYLVDRPTRMKENSPWRDLFRQADPSESQHNFLEAYFQRFLKRRDDSLGENWVLHGRLGSGRTTALRAVVLAQTALGGGRVLWLVPGEARKRAVAKILGETLASSVWPPLPQVGVGLEGIRSWQDDDPADILLLTLEELQDGFFNRRRPPGSYGSAPNERHWERFAWLELVIIDDWMDFSRVHLRHLPFLLAKLRLLRGHESLPLDCIATFPKLADAGQDYLAERLFLNSRNTAFHEFPPLPCPQAWLWTVYFDPFAGTHGDGDPVWRFVELCLNSGLRTMLFRDGLDGDEMERLSRRDTSGLLTVLGDLEEAQSNERIDVAVVVYSTSPGFDPGDGLFHPGRSEPQLVVRMVPEGFPLEAAPTACFPVVTPRMGNLLGAFHAWDVAGLLPSHAVAGAAYWRALGVLCSDEGPAPGRELPRKVSLEMGVRESNRSAGDPIHILRAAVRREEGLGLEALPRQETAWTKGREGDRLFLRLGVGSETRADQGRFISWVPRERAARVSGGLLDLALVKEFRLETDRRRFAPLPATFRKRQDGTFEVEASPWTGLHDYCVPDFDLEWKVERLDRAAELAGCRLFRRPAGGEGEVVLQARLRGLSTYYGHTVACRCDADHPIKGQWAVSAGLLVLGARPVFRDFSPAHLSGRWSGVEGRGFGGGVCEPLPELAAALAFAWRQRVPGLSGIIRTATHRVRLPHTEEPMALFWFFEPWDNGFASFPVIEKVLEDSVEPTAFWESAKWFLEKYRTVPPDRREAMALRLTGQSHPARVTGAEDDGIDAAEALVTRMLGLARERAQLAEDSRRRGADTLGFNTVDPSTDARDPEWDSGKPVTSWAECLRLLFEEAGTNEEAVNAAFGSACTHRMVFSVTMAGVPAEEKIWAFSAVAGLAAVSGLQVDHRGGELRVSAVDFAAADAFREALEAHLATVMVEAGFAPNATVRLRLWTLPLDATGEWPAVDILRGLSVLLIGGYAPDGLRRVRKEIAEPPVPQLVDMEDAWPETPEPEGEALAPRFHAELPPAPGLKLAAARRFEWFFEGVSYCLEWGFAREEERLTYMDAVDQLPARPANDGLLHYIAHDPYRTSVESLADELRDLCPDSSRSALARFCLAFVQAMPYKKDPEVAGDWPRFPSEFLAHHGGDCEDSSLCLLAFLARLRISSALLLFEGHAAVGIEGGFAGIHFSLADRRYFYAETAIDRGYHEIGETTELVSRARVLPSTIDHSKSPFDWGLFSCQFVDRGQLVRVWLHSTGVTGSGSVTSCIRGASEKPGTSAASKSHAFTIERAGVHEFSFPLPKNALKGEKRVDLVLRLNGQMTVWTEAFSLVSR